MDNFVYVARVKKLDLLRIAIVNFIPNENLHLLRIDGFDSDVELLHQSKFHNLYVSLSFGIPTSDDESTSSKEIVFSDLKKYKSPLGNDLFNISLEQALRIIKPSNERVDFFECPKVVKEQLMAIEKKQKEEETQDQNIFDFTLKLKEQSLEIDKTWKVNLIERGNSFLEFKKKTKLNRFFLNVLLAGDTVKKTMSEVVDSHLDNLRRLPSSLQIECKDDPRTKLDELLEPAFDDNNVQLRVNKQLNCTNIVGLDFEFNLDQHNGVSVGSPLHCKNVSGVCDVCGRHHTIWFTDLSLLYLRPLYSKNSDHILNQFFYFYYEELLKYGRFK
jgi:hypothetical protein